MLRAAVPGVPGPRGAGTLGLSEDRCPAVPAGSCARVLTAGVTGNKEPGRGGERSGPRWVAGGGAVLRWLVAGRERGAPCRSAPVGGKRG